LSGFTAHQKLKSISEKERVGDGDTQVSPRVVVVNGGNRFCTSGAD